MAFTVINTGDPGLASVIMANIRHVNFGSHLLPVNSSGTAVDNTIDLGASGTKFRNGYLAGTLSVGGAVTLSSTLAVTSSATFSNTATFSSTVTISKNSDFSNLVMTGASSTTDDGARIYMYKSRGTVASPTTVQTSDYAGAIYSFAHDGTNFVQCGVVGFKLEGTVSTNRTPTQFYIQTHPDSTSASQIVFTINSAGHTTILGDLNINSGKFTVDSGTGDVAFTGDLDINTNKFNVAASSGNTDIAGTLDVTGATTLSGGAQLGENGSVIKTKTVSIGDWNMDSTTSVNVAHGLGGSYTKVIGVHAVVFSDGGTTPIPLMRTNDAAGQIDGGWADIDATNIVLWRLTAGHFDDTNWNQTSFNRGYVTFIYTV